MMQSPVPLERQKPTHIKALTGLRFVAALWVVLYHESFDGWVATWAGHFGGLPFLIARIGFVGVTIFFVLSGFVLALSSNAASGKFDFKVFYVNRFARIYPLYITVAALCLLDLGVGEAFASWKSGLKMVLFILLAQAWTLKSAMYLNPPSWSLSVEAFFYLLFPFCQRCIVKLDRLFVAATVLAIISILPGCIALLLAPDKYISMTSMQATESFAGRFIQFTPPFRLAEFCIGICFATAFARGLRLTSMVVPFFGFALIGILGGAYLPSVLFQNGMGLFAGLIIFALACSHGSLSAILGSNIFVWLGEISYSIYLIHMFIAKKLAIILNKNTFFGFLLYLLILIVSSSGLFYCIERPMRSWLKNFLIGRDRLAVVPATN